VAERSAARQTVESFVDHWPVMSTARPRPQLICRSAR
jgi:hypothetical protein